MGRSGCLHPTALTMLREQSPMERDEGIVGSEIEGVRRIETLVLVSIGPARLEAYLFRYNAFLVAPL